MPWRFKHLSDERTERGTAVLVAGLDCYVVGNVLVFIVPSAIFKDGKRVVTSCVSLMDDGYVVPVVPWLAPWDHLKWWESKLDWAWVVADYYVRRRAAPSVMGLLSTPSFLALWAIVGRAPLVMVSWG